MVVVVVVVVVAVVVVVVMIHIIIAIIIIMIFIQAFGLASDRRVSENPTKAEGPDGFACFARMKRRGGSENGGMKFQIRF